MIVKGGKIGQVVKDGKVISEQFTEVETDAIKYCWRHPNVIRNLDNYKKPTDRDKKILEKIRLVPFKTHDKKGNTAMGRSCPKCHVVLEVKAQRVMKGGLSLDIDEADKITRSNQMG